MKDLLVVTVQKGSIKPDEFGRFREYVIESILRDVLVLDDSMAMDIRQTPEPGVMPAQIVEEDTGKQTTTLKEEKQAILERLAQYREKNGLGCLSTVARKACHKGITDNILRMLLQGDATATIQDWRAIGKALDKLEEENKCDKRQKGGANA